MQQIFEFGLRGEVNTTTIYAESPIKVVIGCFLETTITGALQATATATNSEITSFTDNGAAFKVYLLGFKAGDASNLFSVSLNTVFDWTTDITDCYESQISLVDSNGATSSDTDVYLGSNPTLKDEVTGLVDAVLNIDRTNPLYKDIFVRGQTS